MSKTSQPHTRYVRPIARADGHTLVIGDVARHDARAARAKLRLRLLLRRVAADTAPGAGPAELLAAVDQAMSTQGVDTLTTGIVATLSRLPGSPAWRLRWSNAGHPPPVLVHGDGLISTLATPPDRPLGIGAGFSRSETEVVLQPGTTLLLFTDGLVERRGQVIDDGIRSLTSTLTDLGPSALRDPETLCDELFARLLPGWPEDDAGLLSVHLTGALRTGEGAVPQVRCRWPPAILHGRRKGNRRRGRAQSP